MFRAFARSFLRRASSPRPRGAFLRPPLKVALTAGSLYFLYTVPTIYLDSDDHLAPESHTPRAAFLRSLHDRFPPAANPTEVVNSRIANGESVGSEDALGQGISGLHICKFQSYMSFYTFCLRNLLNFPESRSWTIITLIDGRRSIDLVSDICYQLPGAISDVLENLYTAYNETFEFDTLASGGTQYREPPMERIDEAIRYAFTAFDEYVVHELSQRALDNAPLEENPHTAHAWGLTSAQGGASVLGACYDNHTRRLRLACVGSGRAVLGRRIKNAKGKTVYEVHVLNEDQTVNNPKEVARLQKEHPGEQLLEDGLYFGQKSTRAFGELALKLDLRTQERLQRQTGMHSIPDKVKTPPYLTSEPVITTIDVHPGDFLIMGTISFWDRLTNAEAVGLVGQWLNDRDNLWKGGYDKPFTRNVLPVQLDVDTTTKFKAWNIEKRFVHVDENAASHLMRNAIGGANVDVACAQSLMGDDKGVGSADMEVTIVFFDDD